MNNETYVHHTDALEGCRSLEDESVNQVVFSPPYWKQKDYGTDLQIGFSESRGEYLEYLHDLFAELRRAATTAATLFVIVGDTIRDGECQLIPHRIAILLQDTGWHVRNTLIWNKSDAAPRRCSRQWRPVHEHILFAAKNIRSQTFNEDAIRIPYSPRTLRRWGQGQTYGGSKSGRTGPKGQAFPRGKSFTLNPKGTIAGDVITHATSQSRDRHFATFPEALVSRLIEAGSNEGDLVLDPFCGTGTTGIAAMKLGRRFLGFDVNTEYLNLATSNLRIAERERHVAE